MQAPLRHRPALLHRHERVEAALGLRESRRWALAWREDERAHVRQGGEGFHCLGREMNLMLLAVLGPIGCNAPHRAAEVEFAAGHTCHLVEALTRDDEYSE